MPCMPACLLSDRCVYASTKERSSLERVWLQICPASDGVGDILTEIGDERIRHDNHVARLESYVLVELFAVEYVFKIELLDMKGAVRGLMKEKARGFGSRRESTSNRDAFGHCNVAAQLILARFTHLAGDGKERLLKVF